MAGRTAYLAGLSTVYTPSTVAGRAVDRGRVPSSFAAASAGKKVGVVESSYSCHGAARPVLRGIREVLASRARGRRGHQRTHGREIDVAPPPNANSSRRVASMLIGGARGLFGQPLLETQQVGVLRHHVGCRSLPRGRPPRVRGTFSAGSRLDCRGHLQADPIWESARGGSRPRSAPFDLLVGRPPRV